jgi:chromate reductase, NAD(P)H dehydrogenase (quinone)
VPRQLRVITLIGSLRRGSYTRRVVEGLRGLAPASLKLDVVGLESLPLYSEDDETASPPAAWRTFRDHIRSGDAVLFATPEYNRSIPGALKNAIDVGSRPYGASVWSGKPPAVISVSPGALGAFGANHHLRQCLTFLDMPVLQQPEAYLGSVDTLIDADGRVVRPDTVAFLETFLQRFEHWIRRVGQE